MIEFDKLVLSKMTWREIFDTIQNNFEKVYNMILANSVEVYVEQFEGGLSEYTLQHPVNEDTTLLVYRGNQFIGGLEGEGYTISDNKIIFDEELELDEMVTVQFMQANALANISQEYVEQIRQMYDQIMKLSIDMEGLSDEVESFRNYLLQISNDIINEMQLTKAQVQQIQTRTEATKDYIEDLMQGQKIEEGQLSSEVVAARRGFILLGERLDNMPFKLQSVEEMKLTEQLRDGDVVLIGADDFVVTYKIMKEYYGPIEKITLDNGCVAVKAASTVQIGDYEELDKPVSVEKDTYIIEGTIDDYPILNEKEFGDYYVKGYYKIYPSDEIRCTESHLKAVITHAKTDDMTVTTIILGTSIHIVRTKGLSSWLTSLPSIGEVDIKDIGDGTITGAIKFLSVQIENLSKEVY